MSANYAAMSFAGAVGYGIETTEGSAASRTAWILADSAQPSIKRAEQPNAPIAHGWDVLASAPGLKEVGVNISFGLYASASVQGLIDAAMNRTALTASSGSPGQPTSLTIELVMDNGKSLVLTGCKANQMQLSAKPGEIVKVTIDFQAMNVTAGSAGTPSISTGALYYGGATTISIGGSGNTLVNSFDLTIANNCSRRPGFTGDGTYRKVKAAAQVIRGNMQADFESSDLLDAFLARTEEAFIVTMTAADASTCVIDIPSAYYEGDDPGLSGANPIEDKLPFLCIFDSIAGYAADVTVSADTTAPTCTVVPTDTATNFVVSDNIVATFSEDLRATTVSTRTVILLKDGVAEVAGVVTLANNGASTTITFNPSTNLDADTPYTFVITTEVTDQAGNHLAAAKVINFRTAA